MPAENTPASTEPSKPESPSSPPLLTIRTAVVLLLAFVCGTIVGVLTYLAARNVAAAILAGLTATGGAVVFLHKEIG